MLNIAAPQTKTRTEPAGLLEFDYQKLRLFVGIIALTMPFLFPILLFTIPTSISASYHTGARDIFVGLLFFVSAFLMAYQGFSSVEAWFSRVASISTIFVALFPTSCNDCETDFQSSIHYFFAAILFGILAYFCFNFFRTRAKAKAEFDARAGNPKDAMKKRRREIIYVCCGSLIVGAMLSMGIGGWLIPHIMKALRITFAAEAVALWAFGFAWLVASKALPWFASEDEQLKL